LHRNALFWPSGAKAAILTPIEMEGRGMGFLRERWSRAVVLALLIVLGQGAGMTAALAQTAAQTAESALEPLTIVTTSGTHRFQVEVMRTDEERARGLMFRRFMPADRGMLFDFKREEQVAMWMKNTYIPLDMLFIDRSGKIVNIARDAEPLSERIIPSGAPAYAVLELNGGVARKLDMKVGDMVQHPLFRK
jgi:uncharacterized membrane protein (UPF0127 family)